MGSKCATVWFLVTVLYLITSNLIQGAPIEDISMNSMGHRTFYEELPNPPNHPIDDIEILAVTNSHQKKGFITTSSMTSTMNVWFHGSSRDLHSALWLTSEDVCDSLLVTHLKIEEFFHSKNQVKKKCSILVQDCLSHTIVVVSRCSCVVPSKISS